MLPLRLFDQRSGEHAELVGWSCSWVNPYTAHENKRRVFFLNRGRADKCAHIKRQLKMINVNVTPVTQPKRGMKDGNTSST